MSHDVASHGTSSLVKLPPSDPHGPFAPRFAPELVIEVSELSANLYPGREAA